LEWNISKDGTITEPAQEINICHEADVIVVGGGPGGHSAAIAAARCGARTVLIERYGHLGGMATGGIVIQIPHMSNGGKPYILGLTQEWLDRLDAIGGVLHPGMEVVGSDDQGQVKYWKRFWGNVTPDGRIAHTAWVDPELLKCVLNDMVEEAKVKLYLHSWGVRVLENDDGLRGVVFESKSGRQAVVGKILIDATGDGDLLASAGAAFDATLDRSLRSSMLALVFRIGNCDYQRYCDFRETEPDKFANLLNALEAAAGTRLLPLPTPRNDVMWVNNWIPDLDCINVEDLTTLEVTMRKIMRKGHEFMKKHIPSFEDSFILDTASQTGTRGSRRLKGEYTITQEDIRLGTVHEDTIAIIPRFIPNREWSPVLHFPYRALVPEKVDNLLVAGRSFSSDTTANNMVNLIPHCIATGQAAGTAAVLALRSGINVRSVNYKDLQASLRSQGVPLP
jgi:hypothetical protein